MKDPSSPDAGRRLEALIQIDGGVTPDNTADLCVRVRTCCVRFGVFLGSTLVRPVVMFEQGGGSPFT